MDNGNVGIGTTMPTSPLQVGSYVDPNDFGYLPGTITAYATNPAAYGGAGQFRTAITSSSAGHSADAVYGEMDVSGNFNYDTANGADMEAYNVGSSTVTTMNGIISYLENDGGTVTNLRGISIDANHASNTTNDVGLYLEDQSGSGATNSYNLYSDGSGINYFGGNVGIGTTTPDYALTLQGQSLLHLYNATGLDNGWISQFTDRLSINSSNSIYFGVGNSTNANLVIASNGNVGIGTTSPFTTFAVNGSGYFSGALSLGSALSSAYGGTGSTTLSGILVGNGTSPVNTLSFSGPLSLSGSTLTLSQANAATNGFLASSDWTNFNGKLGSSTISALTSNSIAKWTGTAFANSLITDTGSAIGIGTTSPTAILTIDSSSTTGTIMRVSNSSVGGHIFDLLSTGSGNTGGAGRFDFFDSTVGAARLSIAANGNVGIATTSPDQAFAVNGSLDIVLTGAYKQGDQTILKVTGNNGNNIPGVGAVTDTFVGVGAGANLPASDYLTTAVGWHALYTSTSTNTESTAIGWASQANIWANGSQNTTVGINTLGNCVNCIHDVLMGTDSMRNATTSAMVNGNFTASYNAAYGVDTLLYSQDFNDIAIGDDALQGGPSTSAYSYGSNNVAVGVQAMGGGAETTAAGNVAIGSLAGKNVTTALDNVWIGYLSGLNATSDFRNTNIGFESGENDANSFENTDIGFQAGFGLTNGNHNTIIGSNFSDKSQITTGDWNISIGADAPVVSSTTNSQLNLGNVVFGTNLSQTPGVPGGNIAIGTTTPYSRLEVFGSDAASSTSAFAVVNTSSTTLFAVFDGGNAQLSGTLTQSSDQRLKTNIQDLDGSSSLAEINALNPISFNWIDPNQDGRPQLGFLAQQVQGIFPSLVSTTSPTALTPNGTLGLNYIDLISPIVAAIQELDKEIASLASTVAGFAQSFTTQVLTAGTANFQKVCVAKADGTSVCVTGDQLAAVLAAASQSGSAPASPPPSPSDATDTPPVIQINGDNPAVIQVGTTYTDLGATITGPQADLNLGIETYLNGTLESPIALDTSAAATDTIAYVVTDSQGLTSTSTRTVIVEPASFPASLPSPSGDATSSATTTVQ